MAALTALDVDHSSMTVGALIEHLKGFDPDTQAVLVGEGKNEKGERARFAVMFDLVSLADVRFDQNLGLEILPPDHGLSDDEVAGDVVVIGQ